MKTEKQRKLIVRIGAAILAADDPLGTFRRTIQLNKFNREYIQPLKKSILLKIHCKGMIHP